MRYLKFLASACRAKPKKATMEARCTLSVAYRISRYVQNVQRVVSRVQCLLAVYVGVHPFIHLVKVNNMVTGTVSHNMAFTSKTATLD